MHLFRNREETLIMEKERNLWFLRATFIIILNFHIHGIQTNQVAPLTKVINRELNSSETSIDGSIDEVVLQKIQFKTDLNHLVVDRENGSVS